MAIIGLAQVGGPLLPLDGAHLLLAELLPLLPRDLDGVVLRHGRRRVARPAEEAQLRGTGESGPRRDTLALGTAPRARGTGACAGAGPSLGTHPKRAGACALHRRLCNHAPALQTLARPGLGTANSCTIACRHCKPTYTHTANPRTPTHQHCKPMHQHCKPSHVPVWTLQTLAHPHSSTANPRSLHPDAAHPRTPARRPCKPSSLRLGTPPALAHPRRVAASPRTPLRTGARCPLEPGRESPALPLALQCLLLHRGGLQAQAGPVIVSSVAGLSAAPLEEATLGRKREGEAGQGQAAWHGTAWHSMAQRGWGGTAWHGTARVAWHSTMWHGTVGMAGVAQHGIAGVARHNCGMVWHGTA